MARAQRFCDCESGLEPLGQTPAGEAPATGVIDATYTQRNGGVDLRKLELHLPASELEAHGELGAYPVTSASALNVDFHTHNLEEFDTALRSLGFKRNGRAGTAALPLALAGQADFLGIWTGSLVKPHLAGSLKATQIALEMPAAGGNPGQPQFVRMDSVEAAGSYSPIPDCHPARAAAARQNQNRAQWNAGRIASSGAPSDRWLAEPGSPGWWPAGGV